MIKNSVQYPDYSASELGIVYKNGKPIKLSTNRGGYLFFNIYNSFTKKNTIVLVHKFIAKLFIPNPNNLPAINHIDGDKKNNNVSNLEWCTISYNSKHAIEHKLHKVISGKDNNCTWAKLTSTQVEEIRNKYIPRKYSWNTLAKEYGVSRSLIQQILNGSIWKK